MNKGYNVILSSPWYYDWHQLDKDVPEWERAWDVNMLEDWLPAEDKHRMLGGEGCIWTEFVDSGQFSGGEPTCKVRRVRAFIKKKTILSQFIR